jgi:hypothetical protein
MIRQIIVYVSSSDIEYCQGESTYFWRKENFFLSIKVAVLSTNLLTHLMLMPPTVY